MSPVGSPENFSTIINAEKKQKEYLTKMRNKSLGDTQVNQFLSGTFRELFCLFCFRERIELSKN